MGADAVQLHLVALKGAEIEVLVEKNDIARTPTFAPVRLSGGFAGGSLVRARVVDADARFAYAEAA